MPNNRRPTQEIDREVQNLQSLRSKIPQSDFFGSSNISKIDAQIRVLRERMAIPRIEDLYGDHSDGEDEDYDPDIQGEAMEAYNWRVGDSDLTPSEAWNELAT